MPKEKVIEHAYVYGEENNTVPRAPLFKGAYYREGITNISYYPYIILFGKGTTYDFHPSFWGVNGEDHSEIVFRFDEGFNTIIIGAGNINPYSPFPNSSINLNDIIKKNQLFNI